MNKKHTTKPRIQLVDITGVNNYIYINCSVSMVINMWFIETHSLTVLVE